MVHVHDEHQDETSGPDDGGRQSARPEGDSNIPAHPGHHTGGSSPDVYPSGPIYGPEISPQLHFQLTHQEITQYFPDAVTAHELKEKAPEVYAAWIETTKETIATDNYMRRAAVDNPRTLAARGQFIGFASVVAVLILAGYCAYLNHPWLAGFLCAIDVVALATVFSSNKSTPPEQ